MPHEDAISTKWPSPGRAGRGILRILLLCAALGGSASAAEARDEATRPQGRETAGEHAVVKEALDRMFRMEYAAAEKTLLTELPDSSPARPYFAGMVCLNRFLDLGDTAALARAEAYWNPLAPAGEPPGRFAAAAPESLRLYRGLAGFQLAHVAALRGARLRPAMLALSARRRLDNLETPEARASLMLYDYWRDQILAKIPFVRADAFPLEDFQAAANASPRLENAFLFALFWIHLDAERPEAGRVLVEDFLGRYPNHRLGREMRAAALFRAGRLEEARAEHENLRKEYAARDGDPDCPACLPLGYYRAVGNLARIYAALGLPGKADARLGEWNRAAAAGLAPWLPGSLSRDLARVARGDADERP